MERIVLNINPNTRAGKMLKDLIALLSTKPGVKVEKEEVTYKEAFVKEILAAKKSKKRYTFKSVDDLWTSL